MQKKTFILAVSGGVDSVVLFHKLTSRLPEDATERKVRYIVAHVDHGVRDNSSKDADFVEKMALNTNQLYREMVLRPDRIDEASLREKRYDFLYKLKDEYNAEAIITAHHQDDLLETMVLNIMRGTGPRGLSPMNREGILRPLINYTKKQLVEYAQEHSLSWVEDETNEDESYLRNYIRKNIMPKLEPVREELLNINKRVDELYEDIDIRVSHLLPKRNIVARVHFVTYPYVVAKEIVRAWLLREGVEEIDARMIDSVVIAIKTLQPGRKIDVGKKFWLRSELNSLSLVKK